MDKATIRKEAFARRKLAHNHHASAAGYLSEVLAGYRGVPLAGYMAMRTETDPTIAMAEAAAHGPVGVPLIIGKAQPLQFLSWEPDAEMIPGEFGADVPKSGQPMIPEILIVPLVAFDRAGGRLGYGGGFYDRTLTILRQNGPVLAVGFAYAAQEFPDLPQEATDQLLDLIITEQEVISVPK